MADTIKRNCYVMPEQPDGEMRRAAIAVCPEITHHELNQIYRAMREARPVSMGGLGGDSRTQKKPRQPDG